MATVEFSGTNEGMRQLKDKSWKITIETQEIPPEAVAQLSHFSGAMVKILMSDENISNEMLETFAEMEIMKETGSKTPSKRVRDILFVLWKTLNDQGLTESLYDTFYMNRMENYINAVKAKIDALKPQEERDERDGD